MELNRLSDIQHFQKIKKKIFLYFYDDWCINTTTLLDSFFKEKYDLNKIFIKVKVKNKKEITDFFDINIYPIIKVYSGYDFKSILYCNTKKLLEKIEIIYNQLN